MSGCLDVHKKRVRKRGLTAAAVLFILVQNVRAEIPTQFSAWGSVGPELRAVPAEWKESPWLPDPVPHLEPTIEEKKRGFVVFCRDPFVPVFSKSVPAPGERVTEVKAFATRGEYEPVALALYALEDLRELRAECSDLRAATGETIDRLQMDIRSSREVPVISEGASKTFTWLPFLLEKRPFISLKKGKSAVFWLTIRVPDEANAGEYTGLISIFSGSHRTHAVKISLKVFPFKLPPSAVEGVMCYPHPAEAEEMLLKELTDQREHGTSVPVPALQVRIKSRDRNFGPDDINETVAQCEMLLRSYKEVFGDWRFPTTFEVGHEIAYSWDQRQNWFVYSKHERKVEADLERAIDLIRELTSTNGLPVLRAQIIDEGGAHNLLDEAVYYNRWIKEHYRNILTTTTIGGGIALGYDEIGQLSGPVDFLSINRFTPEIAKALVERNKAYGVYNGGGASPAAARFFFGFYGHKTGAQQILQWAYSFGESVFSGNGLRQEDEGFVYHAPDGPIPSIIWEAVREGIDDLRYIQLLRQEIAGLRNSEMAFARSSAVRAEGVLNEMLHQISWGFQPLQGGNRTPPPHPSTLRKWRWAVAEQIEALQVADGIKTDGGNVMVPSPLKLEWAAPEEVPFTPGPAILPPTDFESELKPWRVEAWTGHGKGTLDRLERHDGAQSVRIDSPATDGNGAVTVLVWPQYGDNKLNLNLEGEHTYELSAWVKMKNRAIHPELRINVPGDKVRDTRTGADRVRDNGWQRLWCRVDLKSRVQPSYLAVWVQGPGTVWVDDLSLREMVQAALRVTLDQTTYDSLDKIAFMSVTLGSVPGASRLRCRLSETSGKEIEVHTILLQELGREIAGSHLLTNLPWGAGTRFSFSPFDLRPGSYEIKVELLGERETRLAANSISFRRL